MSRARPRTDGPEAPLRRVIRHGPLSLRLNFSWTLLGAAVYVGAQWGMITAIARMGTPSMVGRFALGLAIAAPVLMFTNLQLQAVQATDAEYRYRFGEYLALRIVTTMLALAVICGIVYLAGYERQTAIVVLLVGLAKVFEAGSDVLYGLFMQRERMDRMARSMILRGILSLAALGLGLHLTGSLAWGVAGMALAWASVLILHDLPGGARVLRSTVGAGADGLRPCWSGRTLLRLARLALPLGVVLTLVSLNVNIPRYFIEWHSGEQELGIYAAMSYVTVAGLAVVNALGQAASPRLARYYADRGGPEYVRLLLKLVGIGALLGAGGVLVSLVAGREALTLLYGREYAQHADAFVLLMIAAGISYVASFVGYGMTAARYFAVQVPLFAAGGCVTALACLWLVPAAGLKGAAVSVMASAAITSCGGLAVVAYAVRRISSTRMEGENRGR